MKQTSFSIICMAVILMPLSSCGSSTETNDWEPTTYETVNNFDGVAMTAKEGTVSSTGVTVLYKNNSDKLGIFGEYLLLEKEIEGDWFQVLVNIEDYGFEDIGYELAPSEIEEHPIDWDWLYGSLDSGEYRIVKDILDVRGKGDYDKYYLAAQFTID